MIEVAGGTIALDDPRLWAALAAVALALWLAELTAADGFVVHGSVTVPAGSRVSVERA